MSIRFTEAELDILQRRVAEAETGTPGELVVFVVARSSAYEAVLWRGGAVGLAAAVVLWSIVAATWPGWGIGWLSSPITELILFLVGSVGGALLARGHAGVFRALAGQELLAATVKRRAQRAFLEEGVVETASRTGILLFVSVLERRIEVIADKGIDAAVEEGTWKSVVDLIGSGLRRGDLVGAISEGISACGDILRDSGIRSPGADRNELRDDIRFETD